MNTKKDPSVSGSEEKARDVDMEIILLAAEFGFRACEKGDNLQMMRINLGKAIEAQRAKGKAG